MPHQFAPLQNKVGLKVNGKVESEHTLSYNTGKGNHNCIAKRYSSLHLLREAQMYEHLAIDRDSMKFANAIADCWTSQNLC